MLTIEVLQPFRPVLSAPSFDGGGYEVVGWIYGSRWRALWEWAKLLCDRNMHGCLPYSTNPEPWPDYYWAIENAEMSHLARPWEWSQISEKIALIALAHTLRDVREVYPMATTQQIEDALIEMGLI